MNLPLYAYALAGLAAFLILWLAFKIGRFVLRILIGILMLGLLGGIIWYLFLR